MPIKGLTDRKTIKPRLPRLGKLRKGGEKVSANKPGPELSYFRFTSSNSDVVNAFHSSYSKNPSLVNIILFHETLEENFSSWIEAWDASGLVMRSDGENWHIWRDGSKYKRGLKPHVDIDGQKEVGRLEFIIPELLQQGFVGTVTLETHSNHDLRNITSILLSAERERGSLRGAEFVMRRVEEEISIPGWGDRKNKRSKTKKWLVKLEAPRKVFESLLLGDAKNEEYLLPSGDDVAEGEIVDSAPTPQSQGARNWTHEQLNALVVAKYAQAKPHAANILNLSVLPVDATPKTCEYWAKAYVEEKTENALSNADAAAAANKRYKQSKRK